jgi:caa(3)-type oxidase subunit IV
MSEEAAHGPSYYVKIWAILLVLLTISILGPLMGIPWLTLVTAFGIAVVKAWLVLKNFMHITEQPPFIGYMIATSVVFMFLFFAGTAGDVMNQKGDNWYKPQVEIAAPAHH